MSLFLSDEIQTAWQGGDPWARVRSLDGDLYRNVKGRRTLRVEIAGRHYFLKHHRGVGWWEIFKNLLQLRVPVISACNEWRAIQCLQRLGVATMHIAAYGSRGLNPAKRESFILTEALDNTISLEALVTDWLRQRPSFEFKRRLIASVAAISRHMHQAGMSHRDYYLCHFLLQLNARGMIDTRSRPQLFLIDLHRALMRSALGPRWISKDLGGLLFSARQAGLTRSDLLRFVRYYRPTVPLRRELIESRSFWLAVQDKAARVAARERRQLRRRITRSGAVWCRQATATRMVLYRRDMLSNEEPLRAQLIAAPDEIMSGGQMLKDGDSTTVVRVTLNGHDYVIKRYNITGLWHGVRRLLRPSRAWHCWLYGHYLRQMGLETPAPQMMIERRLGPLRKQAWLVTSWQQGEDLLQQQQLQHYSDAQWSLVIDRFSALFSRMQREYLVHGDMKLSNFINNPRGLVLLDLDAMCFGSRGGRFVRKHGKDLARFLRNWQEWPLLHKRAERVVRTARQRLQVES